MTKEEYSRLDEIMNADDQLFAKLVEETQRDNKSSNESKEEPLDISHEEFMQRYHLISLEEAFSRLEDIPNKGR